MKLAIYFAPASYSASSSNEDWAAAATYAVEAERLGVDIAWCAEAWGHDAATRLATRGERLTYQGEIYQLPLPGSEGKALVSSARPRPHIPIYLATLGPKSLELTGEMADGWLGTEL